MENISRLLLPELNLLFVHGLVQVDVHNLRFFLWRLRSIAGGAALLGESQRLRVLPWITNLLLLLLIFVDRVVLVVVE